MGATPTTENIPAEVVNAGLSFLFNLGTTAMETALNVYAPFTALPGIKQLIDMGISWVQRQIYTAIATDATLLIIKFETYLEKQNYHASQGSLQAAIASGNSAVITKAKAEFDQAIDSLGHSDGSAHA